MVLSIIAVVLLIAVGVSAVIRRRTAANAVMLFAFLLLAGLELFDRLALQPSAGFAVYRRISLWLESLLPAAFLLQSVAYRRNDPFGTLPRTRLGLMAALSLFPPAMLLIGGSDLSYSPDFLSDRVLFLGNAGFWYYTGLMASFIVSLANIEATLAATHGRDRNRVKFEAFGIMILLAVLVFYYSQGILHRTVDMNLVPVRSSVVIIAALLIGYSQAFRESGARVSVSRHVLYRSITLLAVGVYLIGLGLFGEGMQYFGVSFGTYLTVVLAFAGGVLLLAVLFSEKVRRRTKVYISKHFYSHKHDY
ncbi:MAG TPA: PEP-CTERM system histidine kinase PrsK, partial [Nitrospirota bacterium]